MFVFFDAVNMQMFMNSEIIGLTLWVKVNSVSLCVKYRCGFRGHYPVRDQFIIVHLVWNCHYFSGELNVHMFVGFSWYLVLFTRLYGSLKRKVSWFLRQLNSKSRPLY